MNQELFEVQLMVRYQIMIDILEEQGEPAHLLLANWLAQNQKEILEAELKFYAAVGSPPLIRYEQFVRKISRLDKKKAWSKIRGILKRADSKLTSVNHKASKRDAELLDVVIHKLYSIRRVALKGALESVRDHIKDGTLPDVVNEDKVGQHTPVC